MLSLILATLISTQKGNYGNFNLNPITTTQRSFVLGNSVEDNQRRVDKPKTIQYGTSYTNQGEAKKLYQDQTNNCVSWAKKQTGIDRPIGLGGRQGINTYEAKIGEIGVERGRFPHAVVIVAINDDDITINESNYIKNWITERVLHRSDFIGFIAG